MKPSLVHWLSLSSEKTTLRKTFWEESQQRYSVVLISITIIIFCLRNFLYDSSASTLASKTVELSCFTLYISFQSGAPFIFSWEIFVHHLGIFISKCLEARRFLWLNSRNSGTGWFVLTCVPPSSRNSSRLCREGELGCNCPCWWSALFTTLYEGEKVLHSNRDKEHDEINQFFMRRTGMR